MAGHGGKAESQRAYAGNSCLGSWHLQKKLGISRIWITELQKDQISIFWPCWVLVIPLLLCALMKYKANVKTSNVVF